MKKEQRLLQPRRTNPLVWLTAIVTTVLTVAVIITGLVVLSIYLIYRPKMPYIRVSYTHLDDLRFDTSGQLGIQMTIDMEADNGNTKAGASFSDIGFKLKFDRVILASLEADPFDVSKNNTFLLHYVVASAAAPLDPEQMNEMDMALKQGKVKFDLTGQARTRWRVGVFLSVKFWTHLDCTLQYFYPNGTSIDLDCTSKSH